MFASRSDNNPASAIEKDDDGFESLNSIGSSQRCFFEHGFPSESMEMNAVEDVNSFCDAWVRSVQGKKNVTLSRQQSAPLLFRESSGTESDVESNTRMPRQKLVSA